MGYKFNWLVSTRGTRCIRSGGLCTPVLYMTWKQRLAYIISFLWRVFWTESEQTAPVPKAINSVVHLLSELVKTISNWIPLLPRLSLSLMLSRREWITLRSVNHNPWWRMHCTSLDVRHNAVLSGYLLHRTHNKPAGNVWKRSFYQNGLRYSCKSNMESSLNHVSCWHWWLMPTLTKLLPW